MISHILEKNRPVYFISPHVDDALLSAGALISSLCKKTTVHIVTVFSDCKAKKSDPPYIKEAKRSIAERMKIEKRLLFGRNVIFHYLDSSELIIRSKNPSSYKKLPHTTTSSENSIKKTISKRLTKLIQNKAIIFCPLGIGGHLDHLIVRDACVSVFKPRNICFWKDYPYAFLLKEYEDSFVNSKFYMRVNTYRYSGNLVRKGIIIHDFGKYLEEFFTEKNAEAPVLAESYFCEKNHSSK